MGVESSTGARRTLRRLELEAYASVVSAFRAQGPLNGEKRTSLDLLCKQLGISGERHRAEVRRAVNDELLSSVAGRLSSVEAELSWRKEGQKLASTNPRFVSRQVTHLPQTLTSALAAGTMGPQAERKGEEPTKTTSIQLQNALKFIISQNPLHLTKPLGGVKVQPASAKTAAQTPVSSRKIPAVISEDKPAADGAAENQTKAAGNGAEPRPKLSGLGDQRPTDTQPSQEESSPPAAKPDYKAPKPKAHDRTPDSPSHKLEQAAPDEKASLASGQGQPMTAQAAKPEELPQPTAKLPSSLDKEGPTSEADGLPKETSVASPVERVSLSPKQPSTHPPPPSQPSTLQPPPSQPSTLPPPPSQPSTLPPPPSQPSTLPPPSQPSTLQPSTLPPSPKQPSTLQPSALPPPSQPSTLQPSTLPPSPKQPSTLQPPSSQPSTLPPPPSQPSTLPPPPKEPSSQGQLETDASGREQSVSTAVRKSIAEVSSPTAAAAFVTDRHLPTTAPVTTPTSQTIAQATHPSLPETTTPTSLPPTTAQTTPTSLPSATTQAMPTSLPPTTNQATPILLPLETPPTSLPPRPVPSQGPPTSLPPPMQVPPPPPHPESRKRPASPHSLPLPPAKRPAPPLLPTPAPTHTHTHTPIHPPTPTPGAPSIPIPALTPISTCPQPEEGRVTPTIEPGPKIRSPPPLLSMDSIPSSPVTILSSETESPRENQSLLQGLLMSMPQLEPTSLHFMTSVSSAPVNPTPAVPQTQSTALTLTSSNLSSMRLASPIVYTVAPPLEIATPSTPVRELAVCGLLPATPKDESGFITQPVAMPTLGPSSPTAVAPPSSPPPPLANTLPPPTPHVPSRSPTPTTEALIQAVCSDPSALEDPSSLATQLGLDFLDPTLLNISDLMQLIQPGLMAAEQAKPPPQLGILMESGPVEQITQLQVGMAEPGVVSTPHSHVEASCLEPSPVMEPSTPVELLLQSPMSQTGTGMGPSTPVELLLQSPMSQTGTGMEPNTPVELLLQSPMSQTGTGMEPNTPVELLLQSPMSQTGTGMEPNLSTPYRMGEPATLLPDLTSLAAAADESQLLEGIPPELAETIQALARLDEQSSMGMSPTYPMQ